MNAIQLEFNFDNESDLRFSQMEKQISEMNESMGKVRRKIFSEVGELKKLCQTIQEENEALKNQLKKLLNEKTNWEYGKDNLLFKSQ